MMAWRRFMGWLQRSGVRKRSEERSGVNERPPLMIVSAAARNRRSGAVTNKSLPAAVAGNLEL